MNSTNFATLVPWIIAHGYFIFFIVATIEGPFITIAAGIAAALGYYNIFIITGLSVIGDVAGDILYYSIGYKSRGILRSRFFRYFGLTEERVQKIERLVHTHMHKAILLVKLSPVIGPFGHIVIGTTQASFKKFFRIVLLIAIPKSIIFAFLGFYSGKTYLNLNKTIATGQHVLLLVGAAVALLYAIYLKVTSNVVKKLEE